MSAKTIIFLGDGMADEPIPALGNRTPLQAAKKPGMDSIARDGACGTLLTLPAGFPTSSEVANMSVLGCDLPTEYRGRGPLEAAGRAIPLGPNDVAFRVNLVSTQDGRLTDYSGGHIHQDDAAELIQYLNSHLATDSIRFHSGVSYRNILVLSGPDFSDRIAADKPDDNHGEPVSAHLPRATVPGAEKTATILNNLITRAAEILPHAPTNRIAAAAGKPQANAIWPWSGGRAGALRSLQARHGIKSAVISAVDVIVGLGRCLGMNVITVRGATGYIDTNYEGKAAAAIEALRDHDLVYLHLEAIDEVSHERNLNLKIKAIEDFDSRIISPVLKAVGPSVNVAVLPDHPVPVLIGKHTRTPVPVAVRMANLAPDHVTCYDEIECPRGRLGAMRNGDLMNLLFPSV